MAIKRGFLRQLKHILGPEHVRSEPVDLIAYSTDGTILSSASPQAIVHPGSVEDVRAIMQTASAAGVPVVPRGAGTGLSGGSIAVDGGIILHFDRMNHIRNLESSDMAVIVEPGVINRDLKRTVSAVGRFYPPDPSSQSVCTIGGNVAENAGGPYGYKYGVTGDYVLSLEAVLASGEVIRTGNSSRRNVTGYDLTSLLVGSEGTLAVVTEITLRLLPQPLTRQVSIFAFDSVTSAGEAVVSLGLSGLVPAAIEIMDRTTLNCLKPFNPRFIATDAAAVLLVEVDGRPQAVQEEMDAVTSICQSVGGTLNQRSQDDGEAEKLWDARRSVSAALGRLAPSKVGEDISVPLSKVPEMMARIEQIANRRGLTIAVFGHAGDGNLHPNILTDRRDDQMLEKTQAAVRDLFETALSLGGTLSGEHGIGSAKAPFLKHALSPETRDAMKRIKSALDPAGIMNPGKIFEE